MGALQRWQGLQGLLFDLDGVLVDSMALVHRTWRWWAEERGLDPDVVGAASLGGPAVETVRRVAPHLDARSEAQGLSELEARSVDQVGAFAGAARLLDRLVDPTRPAASWGIVTSGTRRVALGRLAAARLPCPPVLITADDVERGKPHPECYRRAAALLAAAPDRCVVIEDSVGGVRAGLRAGMSVIAVASSRSVSALRHAHVVVPAITCLSVTVASDGLVVEARDLIE